MAAMKHTFYCIAFRLWGVAVCGVFNTIDEFTEELKRLHEAFKAPSQMDTCSVIAYNKEEARKKAVEYFNENGWDIKGLK